MRPAELSSGELAALLQDLLARLDPEAALTPWESTQAFAAPLADGRISATDQLNWWFRPAGTGGDPWEGFFDPASAFEPARPVEPSHLLGPVIGHAGAADVGGAAAAAPPSDWTALRLLLAEPEDEIIDADAEAVVTCLYDFVHAVGRRDLVAAMECIAEDYHTMEGDDEVDRASLAGRLKSMLDPFEGWELRSSLVEIPHPILHPDAILVYAELLLEGKHPDTDERRDIVERRIAVFRRQRDHGWRIAALSPI
jgi:ketosteroid isomerase-like protein